MTAMFQTAFAKEGSNNRLILNKKLDIIFADAKPYLVAGNTKKDIQKHILKLFDHHNVSSALYKYSGFPAHISLSVNSEILHSVPSDYRLKNGDIVTLELAIKDKSGYRAHRAWTYGVGKISHNKQKLINATELALKEAIRKAQPGNRVLDISEKIAQILSNNKFIGIQEFVGSGMSKKGHTKPHIPSYKPSYWKEEARRLKQGEYLYIIVLATSGAPAIKVFDDRIITRDGRDAAYFGVMVEVGQYYPEL